MTGCTERADPLDDGDDGDVVIDSLVATGDTLNAPELVEVKPSETNCRVCEPEPVMRMLENVARPDTAATVVVPAIVPLPVAICTRTEFVAVVTRLPLASRISTTGAGATGAPLDELAGCVVIAS